MTFRPPRYDEVYWKGVEWLDRLASGEGEEVSELADERTIYEVTGEEAERLGRTFTYHPPKGDQQVRYEEIRERVYELAVEVMNNCPPSRERSLALTKLEEAVMWANASIARNE